MNSFDSYLATARPAIENHFKQFWRLWVTGFILATVIAGGYGIFCTPSTTFVPGTIIHIPSGASVSEIVQQLADARIIKHPALLQFVLRASRTSHTIQMGMYQFNTPQDVFIVAKRLSTGDYGLPSMRMTFIEGSTVRSMTSQIAKAFDTVQADDFLTLARPYEGYLFPDTYLFPPSTDARAIVTALRTTFDKKITLLTDEIAQSGHAISDIVTMASLIEKEARTADDRRIIAGILWNRIRLGMPLQVDAVFGYIFDRDTYSPSPADLRVVSPYNTYLHKGLPPGPICNPGLDALRAAATPAKTTYLYYLTGHDGLMHYATTYAGHQANLKKYLQ